MKADHSVNKIEKSNAVFLLVLVGSILALAGGLALVGYLLSDGDNSTEVNENLASASNNAMKKAGFRCTSKIYPLKYGTCHPDVVILQRVLRKAGAELGSTGKNKDGVDGQFGSKTLAASRSYLNKAIFNPEDIAGLRNQLQA